jgi:hypothetical protein
MHDLLGILDCAGANLDLVKAAPYYEAWTVKDGVVSPTMDTFNTYSSGSNSKGRMTITGRWMFIAGSAVINNKFWTITPANAVPQHPAGSLPHSKNKPPGFDIAKTTRHSLVVSWNCPKDKEEITSSATFEPRLKNASGICPLPKAS